MLLSYPRSGNTWLRYCIENLTSISTKGYISENTLDQTIQNQKSNKVILKRHMLTGPEIHRPIIFILRDYKEVVRGLKEHNLGCFKANCNGKHGPYDYLSTLKSFIKAPSGRKLLIHYEDLMESPETELKKLVDFIGEGHDKIESFINSIDEHKEKALSFYENHGQVTHTRGSLSKDLSIMDYPEKERKKIDDYMKDFLGEEDYNKYLKRYQE